ncbi:MAG TPA: carboxypeptidase-like regulatory domain-containing protein [Gemmatimonadaceae bacterium]|nr:carboxypeptidase-like regulatory domain-containing protein [Gemmatimonadaceae bacterium]
MKPTPILLLALGLLPASTQAQEPRADIITGRVTDMNGRPIADAVVGATAPGSSITRTFNTDAEGRYKIYFPATAPQYSLQVKRMGFAPVQRTINRRTNGPEQMTVDVQLGGMPVALSMVEINGDVDAPTPHETDKTPTDASVPNPIAIILEMKDTLHLSAVQIVALGDLSDTLQLKNARIYKNIRTLITKSAEAGDVTQMAGSVAMMLEQASHNTAQAVAAAVKLLRPEQWAILPADIRERTEKEKAENE